MSKSAIWGSVVVCSLGGIVACSAAEEAGEGQRENVGETALAITPCDLNAPFGMITPVALANQAPDPGFTEDENNFNGLTFASNGDAYLSSPHIVGSSYDIHRWPGNSNPRPTVVAGGGPPWSADTLTQTGVDDTAPNIRANGLKIHLNRSGHIVTYTRPVIVPPAPAIKDDNWSLVSTPSGVNDGVRDQDPFFALGALFFATERTGTSGNLDIYRRLNADSTGTTGPIPNTDINLAGSDESRPVLSSTGLQIYFASNRPGIANDTDGDIFVASRPNTGANFGPAVNLYQLNSSGQEFPVAISADNCTLYFASNENHGFSSVQNHRLYQAKRQENTPPSVPMTLKLTGGAGTVTGSGFNCVHAAGAPGSTGICTVNAAPGTLAGVTATASATWSGDCTSTTVQPSGAGVLTYGAIPAPPLTPTCTVAF